MQQHFTRVTLASAANVLCVFAIALGSSACSGGSASSTPVAAPPSTTSGVSSPCFEGKVRPALGPFECTVIPPDQFDVKPRGRPEPPYVPNPFTARVDGSESLDPDSAREIAAIYAVAGHFSMSEIAVPAPGDTKGLSGETFSLAYATNLDPAFTIHCTLYTDCPDEGQVVHIPGGFMPADGYDRPGGEGHAVIINWAEGREDGFYQLNHVVPHHGGRLDIGFGGVCRFGSYAGRQVCDEAATAGAIAMGGMLLRADELVAATAVRGDLGHVLYITTCVSSGSRRWPAATGEGDGNSACPPMGARIVLLKTDPQIATLNVPEWDRVILRTIAHYGMMSDDNNNHDVWTFGAEDDNGLTSLGFRPEWPAAIALIARDASRYNVNLTITDGSYHIALPFDTLTQADMGVVSSLPTQ